MYHGRNSGYNYSAGMSNRAVAAYQEGAMPRSRWTKEELVEGIIDKNFENGISADLEQKLRKHSAKWLREKFLSYDSWHHTSKHYNRTEFYSILDMGEEEATELILKEEVRLPKEKEKKALSKPVRATWTEFYKHGSRWKTEDITCFGKVKDGWFLGVDNSKKRVDGKHIFYQPVELLEVKRAYRQVRGNLKGFKAWMEK